MEIKSRYCNNY